MQQDTKSKPFNPASQDGIGRHAVIERLQAHREELEGMGVRYLALFGSVVRGDAGPRSDIDVLVGLERPAGLLKFAHVQNYLTTVLEREVDVVPRESVRPQLQASIEREAVRVL